MHHATITTKTIAVQTLILEDVADTEDNNINTIKPIVRYMYYRLFHILSEDKKNIKIVPINKFGYLCPTN